jgi:hypothetical protein
MVPVAVLAFLGCSSVGASRFPKGMTEPIDPASIILTIQANGTVLDKGIPLGKDGLEARLGTRVNSRNHRPILLDVPSDATMRCLKDAIAWIFAANGVNVSFLVRTPSGDASVRLQTVLATSQLRVYDGVEEVVLVDNQDVVEVVARVGAGGAVDVTSVEYTREYLYFPEAGEPLAGKDARAWKGSHPPYGVWSVDTLREFIRRPDLAARTPYVGLEISWHDRVEDVIRCLAALKLAAGSRVEPILQPE